MDINSLLSPQESPRENPKPPSRGPAKRPRKHRTSKLANSAPSVASNTSAPTLPYTSAIVQRPAASPVLSSPASGIRTSATSTPPDDGSLSFRQSSTSGMDTLADLASMQHHQQTARANAGGLKSSEIYNSQSPVATTLPSHQNITRAEATSRIRANSFDVHMAESPRKITTARTFFSNAMSETELEAVTQESIYLSQNPFAYETLARLVDLLHKGFLNHMKLQSSSRMLANPHSFELLQDLQSARESMSSRFALGEDRWTDWIQDQILLATSFEEKLAIRELCEKAVYEESHGSKVWLVYTQWMLSEHQKLSSQEEKRGIANGSSNQISAEEERLLALEVFGWQQVLSVWQRGTQETKWRINDSQQLWDPYTELLIQDVGSPPRPDAIVRMQHWFIDRLQIPHSTWSQTSSRFSSFLSTFDNANWESIMIKANRLGTEAKQKYEMRDFRELSVLRARQKGDEEAEIQAFNDYINSEMSLNRRRGFFSFDLANALHQRVILRFPARTELWEGYIMFLNEEVAQHGKPNTSLLPTLQRATRHCPWSGTLWAQYILAAEIANLPFTGIEEIKYRATSTGILDLGDMDEILKVTTAWCGFLRRRAFMPGSTDEEMDVAEVGIRSAIEDVETIGLKKYGNDYKGDPEYRLEKIYIKYLTQARNWSVARGTFQSLIPRKGHDYDFWLRYYIWEMVTWAKVTYNDSEPGRGSQARPSEATLVLQQAMKRTDLNWPEKILQTYFHHCEDHESAEQFQSANAEVWKQTKLLKQRREKEAYEQYQYQTEQLQLQKAAPNEAAASSESSDHLGKRKRDEEIDAESSKKTRPENVVSTIESQMQDQNKQAPSSLKRDRENATVIVRNLPSSTSATKVRQFFRDCGAINSLRLAKEEDSQSFTATIEFESKEDLLTAQTKDMKSFEGNAVEIQIGSGVTVYVCNFPPTADEAWIRNKFGEFGDIVDVRFPSLKFNTHRRFAYVQFKSSSQARAATSLDGQKLEENIELVAKISDPSHKQDRHGAMYEGRELFISNLPWSATWKDLKQMFSAYGSVESARIPRKVDGSSKGIGFVAFRHKEDALKALALHMTSWKDRILTVVESSNDTAKRQASIATSRSQHTTASPAPVAPSVNGEIHRKASPPADAGQKWEEIRSRTLALLNIPDTINDTRIRVLAEPYGELIKIALRLDHQGAILEYKDQAGVGKASLALEGHEIAPGRFLRIGTLDDLKKMKSEQKSDQTGSAPSKKTAPLSTPSNVRRPGVGAGRRGGKGGLGVKNGGVGLSGDRANNGGTSTYNETGCSEDGPKTSGGPKSNSDFKAMMLNK